MSQIITQHYALTGWQTVLIYSEQEMVDALGLTRAQLRDAIARGDLCYHAHPSSNALHEYQFNLSAFHDNLLRWNCLRRGEHAWIDMGPLDPPGLAARGRAESAKHKWRCARCPAERYDT